MARGIRRTIAFGGTLLAALIAAQAATAAVTEINFWNGITASDGIVLRDLCKKFEKENPNIKVKIQIIDWASLFDKLVVTLAAGKPPEVYIVHPEEFYWFYKAQAMRPMDAFVDVKGGIPKDDRVPSAWKTVEVGNKIMGVPLDNHNWNMYYNKDLFAQNGLDPNSPPDTGQDFLLAAKKILKLDSNGRVKTAGFTYSSYRWTFLSLAKQFKGSLLNEEKTKATLNSEAGVKALQTMVDFRKSYKFAEFGGLGYFEQNKAGMVWEGPWNVTELGKAKKCNWAPAVMPQFGPEKGTWTSSHCMFIPPQIKGAKLQAAWKFVKWMSDHSLDWSHAGQIPVRKSALNTKEFQSLPVQSTFAKMLPYAVFEPSVRKQKDIRNVYEPALDNAVNGKGEVKQLLDKAAEQMNKILMTSK